MTKDLIFNMIICNPEPPRPLPLLLPRVTYALTLVKVVVTHCEENPIHVFLFWDCATSVLISTFMCL
jgi:hypothetical protein